MDRTAKRRTPPQIDSETYAKWLTDKYNKDVGELKADIETLKYELKEQIKENEKLRDSASKKRLKYMNDANEFSPELMKDATIQRYKRQNDEQNKTIKRLRKSLDVLIAENTKLKNNN